MSLKEVHEMDEAAMSLVMLSEQVCDFDLPPGDDDSMDLEKLRPIQEKVLDCVESILDFREMVSDSGFEKSTTCSGDVVALRSELQSKLSHKFNVCGKGFGCYQALGGHKRLHRSVKGRLECKKENSKDGSSLSGSSEDTKIVSIPSSFEVFQEEKILDCVLQSNSSRKCNICGKRSGCYQALGGHKRLHRSSKERLESKKENTKDDTSMFGSSEAKFEVFQEEKMLDCVVSRQDFSKLLPLDFKLQKRPESSSYKCKVCDKSFECLQALAGHKGHHSQLKREKEYTVGDDNKSLSYSSEAKQIVTKPSSFEVSQEKVLHCVELKQDFSELLSYSSSCSKTSFSTVRSESQKNTQSKSSYDGKICGERFVRSQALSNHQRVHRQNREKLSRKRKYSKDHNSLEVSQEKILHFLELKQDFSDLLSHPGFEKSISCSIIPLARKHEKSEDGNSLFGVTETEAKKICIQPLSFEFSQETIVHCVESKQDFSELFSHSGFDSFSN